MSSDLVSTLLSLFPSATQEKKTVGIICLLLQAAISNKKKEKKHLAKIIVSLEKSLTQHVFAK